MLQKHCQIESFGEFQMLHKETTKATPVVRLHSECGPPHYHTSAVWTSQPWAKLPFYPKLILSRTIPAVFTTYKWDHLASIIWWEWCALRTLCSHRERRLKKKEECEILKQMLQQGEEDCFLTDGLICLTASIKSLSELPVLLCRWVLTGFSSALQSSFFFVFSRELFYWNCHANVLWFVVFFSSSHYRSITRRVPRRGRAGASGGGISRAGPGSGSGTHRRLAHRVPLTALAEFRSKSLPNV